MAAEEVPVPPQYVPQPVTDFRGFEDGPRGYKVGVTKKGVLGQKRRLEEYEAQVRSGGWAATRRRGMMCSARAPRRRPSPPRRLLNSARFPLSKKLWTLPTSWWLLPRRRQSTTPLAWARRAAGGGGLHARAEHVQGAALGVPRNEAHPTSSTTALQGSGRSWKTVGERAGSLRNPKLSTSWEKKMQDKAEKAAFTAQKREARDAWKAEKAVSGAHRVGVRWGRDASRKGDEGLSRWEEQGRAPMGTPLSGSWHATLCPPFSPTGAKSAAGGDPGPEGGESEEERDHGPRIHADRQAHAKEQEAAQGAADGAVSRAAPPATSLSPPSPSSLLTWPPAPRPCQSRQHVYFRKLGARAPQRRAWREDSKQSRPGMEKQGAQLCRWESGRRAVQGGHGPPSGMPATASACVGPSPAVW